MSDQLLFTAEPLTDAERAQRFDLSTTINIEQSSSRMVIRRDWVRANAGANSPYGYAEARTIERAHDPKFELTVPFALDFIALSSVLLREIERQSQVIAEPVR